MNLTREISDKIRFGFITLEQGLSFHLQTMMNPAPPPTLIKPLMEAIKNANNSDYEALVNLYPEIEDGSGQSFTTGYLIKRYKLRDFIDRGTFINISISLAIDVKDGMTYGKAQDLIIQMILDKKIHNLVTICDVEII